METICDRSADLELDEKQICDTRQQVHGVLQDVNRICALSGLEERIGPEIGRFQTALEKERKMRGLDMPVNAPKA